MIVFYLFHVKGVGLSVIPHMQPEITLYILRSSFR